MTSPQPPPPPTTTTTTWSTVATMADTEREDMLSRMLTSLAFCDDSNLQNLLSKLLPRAVASLCTESPAVRHKVLEILSHVNKRVKHEFGIGLPLLELWSMYTEATTAPMVRNFCIMYIEMAFDRSCIEDKKTMAPDLLANISKLPLKHQGIVLRMSLKVIGEGHYLKVDDDIAAKYKLIKDSQDCETFVEFCLHVILYHPFSQSGACPAGLSMAQAERVTGQQPIMSVTYPIKSECLLNQKLGILNIIDSMDLPAEMGYPIYLAACADSQESAVKRGEELLKKKGSAADLDNVALIMKLFLLFNGSTAGGNIAPEHKVVPANYSLKIRLMSVFCRSITAANCFPSTLQCIFACIYGIFLCFLYVFWECGLYKPVASYFHEVTFIDDWRNLSFCSLSILF